MSESIPPPQLPPAGWYPDPEGSGLRWWDGRQWTQQVNVAPPAEQSQPPSGATPAVEQGGEGGGQGRRSHAFFLAAAVAIVLAGVGIVVLTAPSDDSGAVYSACRRDVQPVLAAMQGLGSHLDVGVNQSAYAAEVGDVQATYDRLSAKHPATACQPVARALGEAMDAYAQASSEWNECIFSGEEECAEGSVQGLWANAGHAIATAKQRLNSLTSGGDAVAAAESEAEQVEADALAKEQINAAQVAIETYATDHEGSYEGATTARLRAIEPSLPPSLEVAEAGPEYFSISVGSQDGNWFEIDHEIGGELFFKCGEPGKAGCPGSGKWG